MKTNLTVDFKVDKENKTINFERKFDAPADRVWAAWTNSELLDKWWAPKPWKARTKEMDFREGGHWLYAMVGPEEETHWSIAKYKTIRPKTFFEGDDAFTDENGVVNEEFGITNWKITFNDGGSTTRVAVEMSFTDVKHLEQQVAMGFKEGMSMALGNLDELLAQDN